MSTASQSAPFLKTFGICFVPFLEAPKKAPTNLHKCSILRHWHQNDPQSDTRGSPKGSQNPSKIVTKSSLCRCGRPPATFALKKWSRRGESPPNNPKIDRNIDEFRRNVGSVWILTLTPKLTKNGGRSALYFLLLGGCFSRQSSGLVDLKNRTTNVCSFTNGSGELHIATQTTPCLTLCKKNARPALYTLDWCTALVSRPFLPRRNERS